MGMAVDEKVDAGDRGQQIRRPVAGGFIVNAQVAEADDEVAVLCLKEVNLGLGDGEHVLPGGKGHTLNHGGVRLRGGFGGVQTEHADLRTVRRGEHGVVAEGQGAVVPDVGGNDFELGILHNFGQAGVAVVKLVVAQRTDVISGQIHEVHRGSAFRHAYVGGSLGEVAVFHKEHIGALGFVFGLQGRDLGITVDITVHIVGMQDDNLSGKFVGCNGSRWPVIRQGGAAQGECQRNDEQKR